MLTGVSWRRRDWDLSFSQVWIFLGGVFEDCWWQNRQCNLPCCESYIQMLSVATPFHVPPRNHGHSTHMSKFPMTKNMTHSFSDGLITHWALTFYVINSDTMVTARLRCRVHPSLVILSAQQLNTGENIVQSYRIVRLKRPKIMTTGTLHIRVKEIFIFNLWILFDLRSMVP